MPYLCTKGKRLLADGKMIIEIKKQLNDLGINNESIKMS